MSGLRQYLIIKRILDNDDILRDQLKGIWRAFRSSIFSSNFDYSTLACAIYTFLEDHSEFMQMLYCFAELPDIRDSHNLIENKPNSNPVNRGKDRRMEK